MVGLTGAQQFELRAKKALEAGDNSFKPRGAANKAAFAQIKKEFDEQTAKITSHITTETDRVLKETDRVLKETDRVLKEISALTALFGGGGSSNPQERINARQLQNAANNKADREEIRQAKATAKAAPPQESDSSDDEPAPPQESDSSDDEPAPPQNGHEMATAASPKRDTDEAAGASPKRRKCEQQFNSEDERLPGQMSPKATTTRAEKQLQGPWCLKSLIPVAPQVADEPDDVPDDTGELYRILEARAADEYDHYARWLFRELKGTPSEKTIQLEQLLNANRPVWQDRMPKTLQSKVEKVVLKLKNKEVVASINHDLISDGSNLRVKAIFDYEIYVNGNTVAAVPRNS